MSRFSLTRSLFAFLLRHLVPDEIARRIRAEWTLDPGARELVAREDFFAHAFRMLAFNGIGGAYVEFGSHEGWTLRLAWAAAKRNGLEPELWAFDSFQGFPDTGLAEDAHPRFAPGAMAFNEAELREICRKAGIPERRLHLVPGFYRETLAEDAGNGREPRNIALAYVDCDLYSSTREALGWLVPRLRHGMVIVFDDFFADAADQIAGNRRAFDELVSRQDVADWRFVPYRAVGWGGMSFLVEDRRLAGPGRRP